MMSQCTIFKHIFSEDKTYISIQEALDRIKNGASRDLVVQIRKCSNKEEADQIKMKLPAVCFSGSFTARKDDALVQHSGFIVLDFDELPSLGEMVEDLINKDFVYACWISPRGNGLKALVKIADPAKHIEHFEALKEIWPALDEQGRKKTDKKGRLISLVDKSGRNVSRVCYESYDPNIYINEQAALFTRIKTEEQIQIKESLQDEREVFSRILIWLEKNGEYFTIGNRNLYVFKLAAACCRFGIDEASASALISQEITCDHSFTYDELKKTIKSGYRANQHQAGSAVFEQGKMVNKITRKQITSQEIKQMDAAANDQDGRIPPQDLEIEKSVLCVLINDVGSIALAEEKLFPEIFSDLAHQVIYSTIITQYRRGQTPELMSVINELTRIQKIQDAGGAELIRQISERGSFDFYLETWMDILLQHYQARELIKVSKEVYTKAFHEDPKELINSASNKLISIQETGYKGDQESITEVLYKMNLERAKPQTSELVGIDTGIPERNEKTSGLCEPDLIILAARPGQGKTAVALQLVANIAVHQNIPVGMFSLEMGTKQLVMRLEANISGIQHDKIRENKLSDFEREELMATDGRLSMAPIYIDDSAGLTISELRAKATIMKRKYGIRLLIVDYLQLMSGEGKAKGNREGEISEISRGLKKLAKELKIPIIALSQLSREVEKRPDKKPQLADLRESGSIEQDADVVIFLMRPEYYGFMDAFEVNGVEYSPQQLMLVDFAKNRHSSPGKIALQTALSRYQIFSFES